MELIEPSMRKGTPSSFPDWAPCGGISKEYSNFISSPLTYGFIKWRTIHPDKDGMCLLRITKEAEDSEADFMVLPAKGTPDRDGWFK